MKPSKTPPATPKHRRDGSGHLDPKYAAELLEKSREGKEAEATPFIETSDHRDPIAEEQGEEFVATVTGAQDEGQEVLDQKMEEEDGGPFVETDADTEFASGTDASNIQSATREPFPRT
jgi:hypothetical protein